MTDGLIEGGLALIFIATAIVNNEAWFDWLAMAGVVAMLAIATVKAWMHDRKQETKIPTVGRERGPYLRSFDGEESFWLVSDQPAETNHEAARRSFRRKGKEV
jgi:hypothetical protein